MPHPDFAARTLPRRAILGPFHLTPLTPAEADEDFEIVSTSEHVLAGVFGDAWPVGLTYAQNMDDLTRHDRQFREADAFSWIIRSAEGEYLGCAYLYPDVETTGSGRVITWVADRSDRLALLSTFNGVFRSWLMSQLSPGYDVRWRSNDATLTPNVA